MFGRDFGEQLAGLVVGTWCGPIESGYGLHLVRIDAREEGYLPPFEDVRERVLRDFDNHRRATMNRDCLQTLRNYFVTITDSCN